MGQTTVRWIGGSPPTYQYAWQRTLAELQARPGQWAVIGSYSTQASASSVAARWRRRCPEILQLKVNGAAGSVHLYARVVKEEAK